MTWRVFKFVQILPFDGLITKVNLTVIDMIDIIDKIDVIYAGYNQILSFPVR